MTERLLSGNFRVARAVARVELAQRVETNERAAFRGETIRRCFFDFAELMTQACLPLMRREFSQMRQRRDLDFYPFEEILEAIAFAPVFRL